MEYFYYTGSNEDTKRNVVFDLEKFYLPENAFSIWITYLWEIKHDHVYPNITGLTASMPFGQDINIREAFPNVISLKLQHYRHKFQHGFFPDNVKKLKLDWFYDKEIDIGVLPESLNCLKLSEFYNKKIDIGVLPYNLRELYFGFWYNQRIEEGVLPQNITHLKLSSRYSQKIDINAIPKTIKHIYFVNDYDHEIYNTDFVPDHASDVRKEREHMVDILPDGLIMDEITFGYGFDKPLVKNGIKKLRNIKRVNFIKNKHGKESPNIDQIDYNTFVYGQQIFLNDCDISEYIHKQLYISDILPMPIADEIVYNVEL